MFSDDADSRLYRTGDLCRWREDGNLEFLGRIDHQVKLRGFRIELGEIESVLSQHPAVAQSVVTLREDRPGDQRLVAYCVAKVETELNNTALAGHLRRRLPDYMIPAAFVAIESFPLTPSGKVDRRALPAPSDSRNQSGKSEFMPAGNPTQAIIVELWEELLGVRLIGITDNFFELGGHSLLAIQMLSKLEQKLGRRIPVAAFFHRADIFGLNHALAIQNQELSTSQVVRFRKGAPTKRPLFFLHGDFLGDGLYCRSLVKSLSPDLPVFVIHPNGVVDNQPRETIEEIAEHHMQRLRRIQPQGPYRLGGYCNGAVEAFELAQRLRAAGQQVEALIMIDPPSPSQRPHIDIHQSLSFSVDVSMTTKSPLQDPELRSRSLFRRRQALLTIARRAMQNYFPMPYAGRLTLVRSEASNPESAENWKALATEAEIHHLPGNHETLITQHASAIAEVIDQLRL